MLPDLNAVFVLYKPDNTWLLDATAILFNFKLKVLTAAALNRIIVCYVFLDQ